MPKPYDVTTKELMARDPPSWMSYLHLRVGDPIRVMSTDVSTTPAETDQVYRIGGPRPYLVHIEMQARGGGTLPRRLWRYNALLDLKYNLRVRSVAVLLQPAADSRKLTGVLDLRLPDNDRIVAFYYKIVRAWEQPVEPLLTGPLATLPMATLADVTLSDLPHVLERIDVRLMAETPPQEAATMMSRTLTLAGIRLDEDQIEAFRRRLRTMNLLKESSFYQFLLKEQKQAQIKEARKLLIRLGRQRFGRLNKATRTAIESIDDLERLERMFERVYAVSSWAELLAESK
jgi:hypothetical protein